MINKRAIGLLGTSMCFSVVWGMPQQAAASVLEEVIVTASKRSQSMQDVPISVTAFSADAIRELGMFESAAIALYTPNMQWRSDFGDTSPNIFLRGIGNNSFHANAVSAVGIYTDGIYLNSNLSHGFQLFDLERVEVLRGPQGSLYGRNTSAGLVNFISQKPDTNDLSANLDATIGNYEQFDVGGAVNVPVGESSALRLAAQSRKRDGVFDAKVEGFDDRGETDAFNWRLLFASAPVDGLDVLLNVHGGEINADLRPMKSQGQLCPEGTELRNGFGYGCTDFLGFADNSAYHDSFESLDTRHDADNFGASVNVEYTFGDLALTSITGYESAKRELFEDTDRSPAEFLNGSYKARAEQFSQELRLTSSDAQSHRWIVGLFYFEEEMEQYEAFSVNDLGPGAVTGGLFPFEEGLVFDHAQDTQSYAVFGELGLDLTERLSITTGLRWTYDERDVHRYRALIYDATSWRGRYVARSEVLRNAVPLNSNPIRENWSDWSGRIALDYAASEDVLYYASVSRGFKGGEFNPGAAFFAEEYSLTDPEFIVAWELGLKSTLRDGRVRLNTAVFHYDFEDQQVFTLASGGGLGIPVTTLTNAGESRISGLEAELVYLPGPNWFLQASVGWLDSEFEDYQTVDPSSGLVTDFQGNELPSAPEWSLNMVVRRDWQLPGDSSLSLQMDAVYSDEQFFTADNQTVLTADDYTLLGARLAWRSALGNWEVALWGKNLTDEEYASAAFDTSDFGLNSVGVGDPRTYGLTVSTSW